MHSIWTIYIYNRNQTNPSALKLLITKLLTFNFDPNFDLDHKARLKAQTNRVQT